VLQWQVYYVQAFLTFVNLKSVKRMEISEICCLRGRCIIDVAAAAISLVLKRRAHGGVISLQILYHTKEFVSVKNQHNLKRFKSIICMKATSMNELQRIIAASTEPKPCELMSEPARANYRPRLQ